MLDDPDDVRSPQGMDKNPGSVPKMIEIRVDRSSRLVLVSGAGAQVLLITDG